MEPIIFAIIFFVLVVIIAFAIFIKSANGKGWLGEVRVKMVIGKTKPGKRYVINDLNIRIGENKTCQIDHIVINKNGIFVIETKNYSGRIYGQESQQEWTQVLQYGRIKNKFYNPIKQNKTHIYHVINALQEKLPVISAVVFVKCNIQYIDAKGVYTLRGLRKLLKIKRGIALTPLQMATAHARLFRANDLTVTKEEHIKNIRTTQQNIANNICPRCGKNLVMRNGGNGQFLGCEGFPRCKFTKRI